MPDRLTSRLALLHSLAVADTEATGGESPNHSSGHGRVAAVFMSRRALARLLINGGRAWGSREARRSYCAGLSTSRNGRRPFESGRRIQSVTVGGIMPKQSRSIMPRSAHHAFYPLNDAGAPLFAVCDGLPVDDVLEQVICFISSANMLAGQCAERSERGEGCAQFAYSAAYLLDSASAGVASALIGLARSDARPLSESRNFHLMGADGSRLFEVRAGLPVGDVLEQASCFISAAQAMANQCAELSERGESCAQFAYSADYLLDMASGCVHSALCGLVSGCASEEGARA